VLCFIASLLPGKRQPDVLQRSARAPGHRGPADHRFRRGRRPRAHHPGPGPVPRRRSARVSRPGHGHVARSHPRQLPPLRRSSSKSIPEHSLSPA